MANALMDDLQKYSNMVDFPEIYFPITPLDNYLIERMNEVSFHNSFYQFTNPNSYRIYMKRLKLIPSICKLMIHNMKQVHSSFILGILWIGSII